VVSERQRLAAADAGVEPWRAWGPYLSERAWGTVREDYSPGGTAWDYFPHDHARSRAYRWSEDGLGGLCDEDQRLCFAFAFWNGVDPILKERIFGLTGPEGNHGEDAKEYWWYLDSTPTHSWMAWRYHYPQREFPYTDLVHENARRSKTDREYELLDTGVFADDRYWAITVEYAKAAPTDVCMVVRVENRGPDPATLHVLPTLWFRNTWAWGIEGHDVVPVIHAQPGLLTAGSVTLSGDGSPEPLCCDNETNTMRLYGVAGRSAYPKDGINDHLVHKADTVNPANTGTKAALHYELTVEGGQSAEIRLRLGATDTGTGSGHRAVMRLRRAEADEFFAELAPAGVGADEARVLRQAVAGMMWGKQFYHYDVQRWLDGDPAGPPPPDSRKGGRNHEWVHVNNADVISMPDPWEYPWFAAWDLAFHCVSIAWVDPAFAKAQLLLILREWYSHPNGQVPAYEWAFGDVNPPVHAWAALRVFEIDGSRDFQFLARVFHKLTLNFTWWVNRKDADGDNIFAGGFLGLDNIGPIDRSAILPVSGRIEQSDGTAWMAMYALNLLELSLVLAEQDISYEDTATKFLEHFAYIADALRSKGLWDETDGFFYDVLAFDDGQRMPLCVRSMVGLLPLCATTTLGSATLARLPDFATRFAWFLRHRKQYRQVVGETHIRDGAEGRLLAIVSGDRLTRILSKMVDESEFLSPYGLRALSKYHDEHPFTIELAGVSYSIDYEPGESESGLFGGNSNWRGPIWFPVNYLMIGALRRYANFYGTDLLVEYPAGSGQRLSLNAVADDLSRRLISLFLDDEHGRRPVFGDIEVLQTDPGWHDLVPFHEYFHGDTGRGLGASHQTGWTGLVVDLILGTR
jgi:Glycosyl hydrolase family 63 C-terminal domain